MGLTVFDAGVLIGVLDASDAHHAPAAAALQRVCARRDTLVVPASAYAEVLVKPYLAGARAVHVVDQFLADLPADVQPLERSIAHQAAVTRFPPTPQAFRRSRCRHR